MFLVPSLAAAAFLLAPAPASPQASRDVVAEETHKEALEHYRAGLEKMRAESFEEAEREFQTAVKLDPLFVMAQYNLGQTRMSLHRYPAAVQAFLDCREAHHKLAALQQTNQALADQQRDQEIQELQDSIRLFRSGTVHSGGDPEHMAMKLESRLQQLQSEKHRGVTSMETPAEFSLALGSAYFRSGKPDDAEREYREALKANPKLGEAHNNLAVLCFLTKRLDEAEKEMKAAEKSGFAVNPRFKDDLRKAEKAAKQ
jgi:tetratricopeptide (TPR) repeat protein